MGASQAKGLRVQQGLFLQVVGCMYLVSAQQVCTPVRVCYGRMLNNHGRYISPARERVQFHAHIHTRVPYLLVIVEDAASLAGRYLLRRPPTAGELQRVVDQKVSVLLLQLFGYLVSQQRCSSRSLLQRPAPEQAPESSSVHHPARRC